MSDSSSEITWDDMLAYADFKQKVGAEYRPYLLKILEAFKRGDDREGLFLLEELIDDLNI